MTWSHTQPQLKHYISIADPITGVTCDMADEITVLDNVTLTLSCNGRYDGLIVRP